MEEYDSLSAGPSSHGVLDLTHSAWSSLPSLLFTFSERLLSLDLSHNKLVEVEADMGKLHLLSSLNLTGNMVVRVHPDLGKCIRLKTLVLDNNRISELPQEIGRCTLLEVLSAADNFIETLPSSIGNIVALRIVRLQNNKLKSLPPELARIPTIQEVHCEGNPELEMVPDDMRGSSDMVIWALRLHRTHQEKVQAKVAEYDRLEEGARESEEVRLRLKDERDEVAGDVRELEESRPVAFIALKAKWVKMGAKVGASKCSVM